MISRLGNDHVTIAISDGAAIVQIENRRAGETYEVSADAFRVDTDRWSFDSAQHEAIERELGSATARYVFQAPEGCVVELTCRLQPEAAYAERHVTVRNGGLPLTLKSITLGMTAFANPPVEVIDYDTFWHCPTVTFLRWPRGGIFAGFENPFFATRHDGGAFAQSFEPALILRPGEVYTSEPQFVGVYRRSGHFVQDFPPRTVLGQRPRFGNPCGHIPLDRAEIRAMQRFAAEYLDVPTRRFHFILYNFFYPLPRMPRAGSPEEALHLRMIDTFVALGGDLAILNPMHEYRKPEGRADAFWDLAPAGTGAGNILRYAQSLGIGCGFYTGCALHGAEGNAAALPFVPERLEWKKTDALGNAAAENCMACDDYADWFFTVQRNTIARYDLKVWDWDPGPGNGCFCHNPSHGHLPGKGGYKGWRNATALMRRLRDAFPGIYFQAFYGRKEYGLWGFRYFDQHESYWEVSQVFAASMHPELHADRMNADQIRDQAFWNQTFRFHPPQLSHSMTHRQQEGHWDSRLSKTWDALGWRYSFMSTLAACGSVLTTILPEDLSLAPEMREFYATWLAWARANYDVLPYSIPFGEQLRPGCVDGWARIKGERGFVFLCNPNPRPAYARFKLDDEIGLAATSGLFTLTELYPVERRHRGTLGAGEEVALVVPSDEIVLLELKPAAEGTDAPAHKIATAERPLLVRALDNWCRLDGTHFAFPRHAAEAALTLETTFHADPRIRDLLAAARPPNLPEIEPLIPQWKKDLPDNFAWARPDRLWLVIPFADADQVREVTLRFNDRDLSVESHVIGSRRIICYADVTDAVKWGKSNRVRLNMMNLAANQFMGPYLDYPPADPVAEALAAETALVIYDGRPLADDPPSRVPSGSTDLRMMPVVTSLNLDPGFLREGQATRIVAKVNLPPEEIAEVLLAGTGWADGAMRYDAAGQCWISDFTPGPRWGLIMDVPRYYVWAVAKNGLISPRMSVEVVWRFGA